MRHTILGPRDNKPEGGSAHWRFHGQVGWKVVWLWQIPEIARLVFMLLLLVNVFTMSTWTRYILCIGWKVFPTYTYYYLENCETKRIGHCVTSQLYSHWNWYLRFWSTKWCSMCYILGHSKKISPNMQVQANNIKFMSHSLYFKKFVVLF